MWRRPDTKLEYIKYVVWYLTTFVTWVGQALPPSIDYKLKVKRVTYNVTTMIKGETTYSHKTREEGGWEKTMSAALCSTTKCCENIKMPTLIRWAGRKKVHKRSATPHSPPNEHQLKKLAKSLSGGKGETWISYELCGLLHFYFSYKHNLKHRGVRRAVNM